MSKRIDVSKFKDVFIDRIHVGEMWFRGILLYVKKKAPKVTLRVSVSNAEIQLTAQFVDYEHRYRYADERKYSSSIPYTHGIAFKSTSFTQAVSIGSLSRLNFEAYSDDGTFTYFMGSDKYGSKSKRNWFKAWIAYTDPETGKSAMAYSGVINATYNELLNNGPKEA